MKIILSVSLKNICRNIQTGNKAEAEAGDKAEAEAKNKVKGEMVMEI
jgi:hypothetical protein